VTAKGSLTICVAITVGNNAGLAVDYYDDEMIIDRQEPYEYFDTPWVTGNGSFDVSAGTLKFDNCVLKTDNQTAWTLTGGTSTIHVTSLCDCGGESYDYTACDIDVRAGTLEVDNTFKTNGDVDLSGGMLQVDEQFTGKGELNFSGGTIKVAAGKIAAFTPND